MCKSKKETSSSPKTEQTTKTALYAEKKAEIFAKYSSKENLSLKEKAELIFLCPKRSSSVFQMLLLKDNNSPIKFIVECLGMSNQENLIEEAVNLFFWKWEDLLKDGVKFEMDMLKIHMSYQNEE